MPIQMTCPGCNAGFRLDDRLAGKNVRCQKCQQMFAVPMEVEAAVPVMGPPPPVVAEPMPPTLVEPPADNDEPVEAALVEPSAEPEPTPAQPPPLPGPPMPPQTASVGGSLALLLLFFVALASVGTGSAFWVVGNLSPSTIAFIPPRFAQGNLRGVLANKDRRFIDVDKRPIAIDPIVVPVPEPTPPLPVDGFGRASLTGDILGGKQSFRVFLLKGRRYNFYVKRLDFAPRIQLHEGDQLVADKKGAQTVLLTFMPIRDGDHTLTILPQTRRLNGDYALRFAPVLPQPILPIDLMINPNFTANDALRIQDLVKPTLPANYGPVREYPVFTQQGTTYRFQLSTKDFAPLLRLQDGKLVLGEWRRDPITGRIDFIYKAAFTGRLTVLVTSENRALGNYTLTMSRRPDDADKK